MGSSKITSIKLLTICSIILILFAATPALAAPVPTVTLTPSTTSPFIGNSMTITATFNNTGPSGHTGYGPFIDLVFPSRGADGDPGSIAPIQPVDGISFGTATYMVTAVTTFTFPDADGAGAGYYNKWRRHLYQ